MSYHDFRPSVRLRPALALRHDGATVAYLDDANGQFNVTVHPVSGGTPRRITSYTDNTVREVAWHPDGQSLVYLADSKGDENAQLYRVSADGGDPEVLTDTPDVRYITAQGDPFSPDGRFLAYTGNDRAPGDQDVLIRDLESGEVRRAYAGGGRVFVGYWSPDGARVSAAEWIEGNSDHIVYLVPADGGPARRLTPEGVTATYWLGPWLPDGSGIIVRSNAGREFTGLATLDATTGELAWLDTPDWEVEEVALSANGRVLAWTVNVDGASLLRARDMTTGADLPVPTLPMGDVSVLTISRDGAFAAILFSTPTRPWNVAVVDLTAGERGALRWLTDAAPSNADPTTLVEPTVIRFPSREGSQIPAALYRPTGTTEPVGVVISIHGGPVWQDRMSYLRDGLYQYLLSKGIAILAPNIHGSWGYGKSYVQRLYRDWGGIDLDDLAGAATYLREQSWVDPDRIGLYGASYGGFAVLSCVARLPEFNWAAAVDLCGPSNLVTLAKASPPTIRTLVAAVIGDPDTDAEFLLSRSPVTYSDNIRAPLFIIQGANDPRVPQHESDQIVARMRDRGIEVRYDVYADEGHGFTKSETQVKVDSDSAEFLIAHLQSGGQTSDQH